MNIYLRSFFIYFFVPVLLFAQGEQVDARQFLDSLLRVNAHALTWHESTAKGPGIDLIMQSAHDAQFVVIGEQHLTKELPIFTSLLFKNLQAHYGFEYAALEEGPILCTALNRDSLRGNFTAIRDYILKYPNSVHMLSEDEVRMFADISGQSIAENPLWGVNESVGASHILAELKNRSPDKATKHQVQKVMEEAEKYERERYQKGVKFYDDGPDPHQTDILAEAYAADSLGAFMVEMLALAHKISAPYGVNAQYKPGDYFRSSETREESMKELFVEWYKAAVSSGDTLPKVLVKSGNVHVRKGFTPNSELLTFGNFLSELARFNNRSALFITAHVVNEKSVYQIPDDSWFKPIADASFTEEWTVFDLRPIQPWIRSRRLRSLPPAEGFTKRIRYVVGYAWWYT